MIKTTLKLLLGTRVFVWHVTFVCLSLTLHVYGHRGGSLGGGGGGTHPKFLSVCAAAKWKMGQGLRNELPVERENAGLRNELEPFELENAGLRKELDPFWAWKWESPELPGRVWLTRGAAERSAFGLSRPWEAMNGLKLKKFWKWWSPEQQNPPKNVKWWCSGTDFFLFICENDMRGTYPICILMEVPPWGRIQEFDIEGAQKIVYAQRTAREPKREERSPSGTGFRARLTVPEALGP